MVVVNWKGGMAFEADPPSGRKFVMDALPEFGGEGSGPSPVEALVSAVAACSAMDVIGILEKQRQKVHSYRIEVEWTRAPQGEWPRPITSMVVRHVVKGENINEAAVAKAVELSDTKYCSVIASFRFSPQITSEYAIED